MYLLAYLCKHARVLADMEIQDLPEPCAEALGPHMRPEVFQALADPTRLMLIARLAVAAEPLTVTAVAGCCGVHLSGVSRHLAALRDAGLVEAQREGREVRYRLDCGALATALRGFADGLEECRKSCCG